MLFSFLQLNYQMKRFGCFILADIFRYIVSTIASATSTRSNCLITLDIYLVSLKYFNKFANEYNYCLSIGFHSR